MSVITKQLKIKSRVKKIGVISISLILLLSLPACVSNIIARQMIAAPSSSLVGYELAEQFSFFNEGHSGLLAIPGIQIKKAELINRDLVISYIDIPAGNYGFKVQTSPLRVPSGRIGRINTYWQWNEGQCGDVFVQENTGKTLVLLHGWGRNNRSLLSYGLEYAQYGYRVILPDLRGHGETSGDWVSFGEEEGKDLSALMDALAIEHYSIFGFSLGASAGIHVMSNDNRVEHLIAVAPMHSLSETIPKFVKQSPKWLGDLITRYKNDALERVDSISGYMYKQSSNTFLPAKQLNKPVLYIYGSIDNMSGFALNKALSELGSNDNKLVELKGLRHTHVLLHQTALSKPIRQWLGIDVPNETLSNNIHCKKRTFRG